MAYVDHFRHADDLIAHLNGVVPTLADPLLRARYVGLLAVAAVTVYELATKEILISFAERKHKVLGAFSNAYFEKINGRIRVKNIKEDYVRKFGEKYEKRFQRNLERRARIILQASRRDFRAAYGNVITWRNDFAHEGRIVSLATYPEMVQAYEDGKEVMHVLARTMTV